MIDVPLKKKAFFVDKSLAGWEVRKRILRRHAPFTTLLVKKFSTRTQARDAASKLNSLESA